MKRHKITIWDDNPMRIMKMETHLHIALAEKGMNIDVQINNERPLLARNGMIGTMPAFQVDEGDFWRLRIGESVSIDEFRDFLSYMIEAKQL